MTPDLVIEHNLVIEHIGKFTATPGLYEPRNKKGRTDCPSLFV
jgi:hypothetical protein